MLNKEKILNLIRKNIFKKLLSFVFVGITGILIEMVFFNFFYWTKLEFVFSKSLAIFFAIIYNFSMNRNITFKARGYPLKKQIPKYILIYAIAISINFFISLFVLGLLGENTLNANIASLTGIAFSVPISFFGSLLWTFKKNKLS